MNRDLLLVLGVLAGVVLLGRRAAAGNARTGAPLVPAYAIESPCVLDPTTGTCYQWEIPNTILPVLQEQRRGERANDPCRALCGGDPSCEAVCG